MRTAGAEDTLSTALCCPLQDMSGNSPQKFQGWTSDLFLVPLQKPEKYLGHENNKWVSDNKSPSVNLTMVWSLVPDRLMRVFQKVWVPECPCSHTPQLTEIRGEGCAGLNQQEGYRNPNNHSVPPWWAEKHPTPHIISNLEVDVL